jgi:nicotinamidase-related amidase
VIIQQAATREDMDMNMAFLVIDVQKEIIQTDPVASSSILQAIDYINAAIVLFRKRKLPIIGIQHINKEEHLAPGLEGFDIPEEVKLLPSDIRIQKTHSNAFVKTELQKVLQDRNVNTILLSGYCAEYCVLSTYRGARDLDMQPIILRGAIASDNPENIRFVENINEIISLGALEKFLE